MEFMKNIVLIGMPGTGKSTMGTALAEQLNDTFIDLDDSIKGAAGKSLPDIVVVSRVRADDTAHEVLQMMRAVG